MNRERGLKIVLVVVGLLFVAGVSLLATSLGQRHQTEAFAQMMMSIYVTLGVFLLVAVRHPSDLVVVQEFEGTLCRRAL